MKPFLSNSMTHKLITVQTQTSCSEALATMRSRGIRHLPVVDRSKEAIVGMLSDRDLLQITNHEVPVAEVMSSPIFSFDIETPMLTITEAMIEHKVSAFLVTKDGEVEGIVTSEDLLLLLAEILGEQPSAKWVLSEFLVNPQAQKYLSSQSPSVM